ncbi:fimbrial protein [Providencia hangzhouensis]
MKKIIATAIFAALCVGQVANAKDGTVKFVGDIVTAPCEVAQNSGTKLFKWLKLKQLHSQMQELDQRIKIPNHFADL